ncbi:MAG: hypothetical protein KJ587_06175 [Alphaproteobacteria bacterium]|nr:hypothetical protein [Alphaproteobacteria bacterium]
MHGGGVKRLAQPRLRHARALRFWAAGISACVALGLVMLAGRQSVEPSSLEMFQIAGAHQAAAQIDGAGPVDYVDTADSGAASGQRSREKPGLGLALKPAFKPVDRSLPTTRWNRKANLGRPAPVRKF